MIHERGYSLAQGSSDDWDAIKTAERTAAKIRTTPGFTRGSDFSCANFTAIMGAILNPVLL
jgi:hypothetical protein